MQIIVHRGTNQIGGCATEIATAKVRIFIDFGAELNGNSNLDIDGVTKGNTNCSAIFFTHYHGDHIGLINSINKDIPCYIGSLSIDILKIQNNRTKFIEPERLSNIRPYYVSSPSLNAFLILTVCENDGNTSVPSIISTKSLWLSSSK